MMRFHLLLGFLLLPLVIYAQEIGNISGRISDNNNSSIEFANVYITPKNDSTKIIKGTVSDSTGKFTISQVPIGEYVLSVQLIGYTKYQQAISLNANNKNIALARIILTSDATILQNIEIKGDREIIQKTEEGIVVNAQDNLTQIGGTASDLLKNMPGVLVGSEGEISIRGKSPLILINGRVSGIGGVERSTNLEQIPASSIERIEIITNPSAKYDADAEGGIINLILKKSKDVGTNGAFALGAGFGERYRLNGTLQLNHQTPKWNIGLAYDNWYTTRTRRVNGDRVQFDIPSKYFLTQRRSDERILQNQNTRLNLSYLPDKKNSLYFETIWSFQGQDNRETLVNTTQTISENFTDRSRRFSNEIGRSNNVEMLLNYERKFDKSDQVLTVKASTALDFDDENTNIDSQELTVENSPVGNPFLQKTHNYENSRLSNLALDYSQPIRDKARIDVGFKSIFRYLNNDFLRQDQINEDFVTDTRNTDIFSFKEQIHAAYVQYSTWIGEKQMPKWKYNFGMRAEQVLNEGNTQLNPIQFNNRYFKLYPSAQVIYNTPKGNMWRLSYSRRINRPGLGQLSPFTDITDSLNQRSGNPKLRPELAHSLELAYNQDFTKGNISSSIFYRNTSNIILPYTNLDNNGVAFTQPQNFGKAFTYGWEGILTYNPLKIWQINLNLSVYELRIKTDETNLEIQRNQLTYFAKFINNLSIFRNGKLQIVGNYTSPIAIPQGERIAVYFWDIGFQQKILKEQGRIGFTITDVFNTQQNGFRTSDNNFTFSRIFKIDTRALMFTFGYTFKSKFKENLMDNKFIND